ncbi:MAG: UbiX family flavin prenyltransferase, partial [Duganella sp.]
MPDQPHSGRARRLIIAITGATGAVYGVRLLQHLQHTAGIETHLLVSDAAVLTLHQETGLQRRQVEALAHVVHKVRDVGASIASGSFQSDGMIVAPCSMKTLAAVAHGLSDNLIA